MVQRVWLRNVQLPTKARLTSELVPDLQLTHGRSVWVLRKMGFSAGVSPTTFNHYIKSLRKLGVPFGPSEIGSGLHRPVYYTFNHMMELALALSLRVYGTLPDPVLKDIVHFRHDLYPLYRRAYLEYATGLGKPITVHTVGRGRFEMRGVYLDLKIRFSRGRTLEFGRPRLLSPFEALQVYARLETASRTHLPLNLSSLAIVLVECAEAAPNIHRGPAGR